MTRIDESILDELYRRFDALDMETGEGLAADLTQICECMQDVIDWRSSGSDTVDGDICRMIANGLNAYIELLDDEELSDILPRLDDFITGALGLLWFVGKNM